jgi:lambda family phage portal protein
LHNDLASLNFFLTRPRVFDRFIFAGLAGEYATKNGLTDWPEGAAIDGCMRCFDSWLEEKGGVGNIEKSTILRAVAEAGECFIKFCISKANKTVPLQLQVLESEHLDSSKDYPLPNGNVIKSGIEFNSQWSHHKSGKRIAYHLFKEHPGDGHCSESIRVPASEILHVYKVLRPGQIRGEPWLARVLLKLYELDQYDDAELVRKKTAAMFAGFVTRADPEDNVLIEQGESGNFAGLEPGTMQFLDPGEDVKFTSPSDVGGNFLWA